MLAILYYVYYLSISGILELPLPGETFKIKLISPNFASGARSPFRYAQEDCLGKNSKQSTVDQLRKASSADPYTFLVVSEGEKVMGIFAGSAGETTDRVVFLLGLGFCFFSVKFDGVSFFNGDCTFGTDAYAKTHAVTEVFGYNFCLSVDDLNGTFGTGSYTFSTTCTFFFVNFYNHSFYHVNSPLISKFDPFVPCNFCICYYLVSIILVVIPFPTFGWNVPGLSWFFRPDAVKINGCLSELPAQSPYFQVLL
jgi:hypothetical protein